MADDKDPKAAPDKAAPAGGQAIKAPEGKDSKKKAAKPKLTMPVLQAREQFFFKIFVFSFTLLMVDIVMIHPISNYLQKLDETIKMKEEIIPKRLMILKHKDRILGDYRAIKPFFVNASLSQEEETALFLREIERVSKEANLFVSNINPMKVNKVSETVHELSIDVEAKGGLKDVWSFISAVERNNPSIRVSTFTLKPQSKEASELKVLFTIVKLGVKTSHPSIAV